MNQLRAESIPEEVIAGASALVLTSYLVRCKPGEPMPDATMQAIAASHIKAYRPGSTKHRDAPERLR